MVATVLLAQNDPGLALALLERLLDAAVSQGRTGSIIEIQALRAYRSLFALLNGIGSVTLCAEWASELGERKVAAASARRCDRVLYLAAGEHGRRARGGAQTPAVTGRAAGRPALAYPSPGTPPIGSSAL